MMSQVANYAELREQLATLLDAGLGEQEYQAFLERNSSFIPRVFMLNHGIQWRMILRKLAMARDYCTDFFFLTKSTAYWHAVAIEIEKPTSRFFNGSGTEFHSDFKHAVFQINEWRAWFALEANLRGFLNGTLQPLTERMRDQPVHMKYVLVMGRRAELSSQQRRNLVYGMASSDFHIMTYDGLLEDEHWPCYVAARKNDCFEVLSNQYAGEALFYLPPEQLRIKPTLREDVLAHKSEWFHLDSGARVAERRMLLDRVLPLVPLTSE